MQTITYNGQRNNTGRRDFCCANAGNYKKHSSTWTSCIHIYIYVYMERSFWVYMFIINCLVIIQTNWQTGLYWHSYIRELSFLTENTPWQQCQISDTIQGNDETQALPILLWADQETVVRKWAWLFFQFIKVQSIYLAISTFFDLTLHYLSINSIEK